MAITNNLVHAQSTSTGTGNMALVGLNGRHDFPDAFSTGGSDVFYYYIAARDTTEWECGTGSLPSTGELARDTIIDGSNGASAVSFTASTKDITSAYPSSVIATNPTSSDLTATATGLNIGSTATPFAQVSAETIHATSSITAGSTAVNIGSSGATFGAGYYASVDVSSGVKAASTVADVGTSAAPFGEVHANNVYTDVGINLGGDTTVNLLDDFEKGAWTPSYDTSATSFATLVHGFRNATYTKHGPHVECQMLIRTSDVAVGSASGSVIVSGLPFAPDTAQFNHALTPSNLATAFASTAKVPRMGFFSGSTIILSNPQSAQGQPNSTGFSPSDMTTGAVTNANQLTWAFSYRTSV